MEYPLDWNWNRVIQFFGSDLKSLLQCTFDLSLSDSHQLKKFLFLMLLLVQYGVQKLTSVYSQGTLDLQKVVPSFPCVLLLVPVTGNAHHISVCWSSCLFPGSAAGASHWQCTSDICVLIQLPFPWISCWCQSLPMHIRYLCVNPVGESLCICQQWRIQGGNDSPLVQIISFSCRFRQKNCQIIGWRPLWEIRDQPLVKDTSFSFYKDLVMITNDNDCTSALGSRSHRYHILQTYFVLKLFALVIHFILLICFKRDATFRTP